MAAEALAVLAGAGLPGAPTEPVSVDSFAALLDAAERSRVLPFLDHAVAAGMVADTTPEFEADLAERVRAAADTTMAAHAALADLLRRAEAVGGPEIVVLKGCATGHLDYGRAVDRFSSDVDVLVRAGSQRELTGSVGVTPPIPRRRRWQDRYGKAVTIRHPYGIDVDVHVTLAQGYFGLAIPAEELFAAGERFEVGGVSATALDGPNRLLHAAIHQASPGHAGLHSARDVPQLVLVSGVAWEEAVARAERWRVDALVARGVLAAWGRFRLPDHPIVEWARSCSVGGVQRTALALNDRRGGDFLSGPLALPPWRWPGYLLPLAFPSRAYLRQEGVTWRSRLRRVRHGLLPPSGP